MSTRSSTWLLSLVVALVGLVGCEQRDLVKRCEEATGTQKYERCAMACGRIDDGVERLKTCQAMKKALMEVCAANGPKSPSWSECQATCKTIVLAPGYSFPPGYRDSCKTLLENGAL